MSAIRFVSVSKCRGSGARAVDVLRNVCFSVDAGEVVLLLGPSGSGKTTLLALAAGLLSPDAGTIEVNDARIDDATQSARRAMRATSIGFVFQRANLLGCLTARDNVRLMAQMSGKDAAKCTSDTDALLERLGILALADRLPRALSGGEEQRVAIARALVNRPAIILADEPTASLDAAAGHSVGALLKQAGSEYGAAVIIATHDQRLERYGTRSLCIDNGMVQA